MKQLNQSGPSKNLFGKALLIAGVLIALTLGGLSTACSDGGSGAAAYGGTGSLLLKLGEDAAGGGETAGRINISRLVMRFYEGLQNRTAGSLLFTREIEVAANQSSVLVEAIPAPRDYLIVIDMYVSGGSSVYRSPRFWASTISAVSRRQERTPRPRTVRSSKPDGTATRRPTSP